MSFSDDENDDEENKHVPNRPNNPFLNSTIETTDNDQSMLNTPKQLRRFTHHASLFNTTEQNVRTFAWNSLG